MSDFEKDVLSFLPRLKAEKLRQETQHQQRLRRDRLTLQTQAAEEERLRGIGSQAAEMLIRHQIPTIPVVIRPRIRVGEGWHIMTGLEPLWYAGEPIERRRNYSLHTDGTLNRFAPDIANKRMSAIKDPNPIELDAARSLIEGDGFKKAVASLVAGLGVYELER